MTRYKITVVHNDEYCLLRPSDENCQHTVIVEAASKGEAALKMKDERELSFNRKIYSACPIVWEVTKV